MIGPALALVWVALAADGQYVRSRTTAGDSEAACLHWIPGRVEVRQSDAGATAILDDAEFEAISRAVSHWKERFDGCSNLTFREGPRTRTRNVGYRAGASDNENILLFREQSCTDAVDPLDACWANGSCGNAHDCWEHSPGTIALTTTSFDPDTGRMFDADVEANAVNFFFTTVDGPPCQPGQLSSACVAFDVENTFTHELGHVVGLAHTTVVDSTMNPSAPLGETSKRQLDPGTLTFVCAAYPAGLVSTDCRPPPTRLDGSSFNCSQVPGGTPYLLVAILGWLGWRRRRGHHRDG